jgi:hypothetical protein
VCNAQKTVLLKKNIRNLQVGEIWKHIAYSLECEQTKDLGLYERIRVVVEWLF